MGNMVILICPIALYRNGSAFAYIKMGGRRAFCTPKFIIKHDKLSNTDMGKYFFEKLPLIYFKEAKRPGHNLKQISTALVDLPANTPKKGARKVSMARSFYRQFGREGGGESKHGTARKQKRFNQVLMRKREKTERVTIHSRKEFMMFMQMNRSNSVFQSLAMVQKAVLQEDTSMTIHQTRFILEK